MLLSALVMPVLAEAQNVKFPGGPCRLYRVTLADKHGTPYSLNHPEKYLSAKAIARRNKQKIGIDSTDLPITPAYIAAIEKKGVQAVSKSKWNNTVLIKTANNANIDEIEHLPFVKSVRCVFTAPDSIANTVCSTVEEDTTKSYTTTAYGTADAQIGTLNGKKLHEAGFRGKGMTIGIIDGGFMNVDRIPLLKNVNILGAKNFAYPATQSVYRELDHGTCVLSTIAANIPGRMVGTAPDAAFWLLRSEYGPTESEAEEDYWAAAAEFADSVGVDIINSSLGYHDFDDAATSHTYKQLDGRTALISHTASMLAGKGIVLCNSAGNDGAAAWKKIGVPADARDILAVGAMKCDSINTTFSSVGNTADGRVKPDIMAMGYQCAVIRGSGHISRANGTSFASPVACGLVACLWQALPQRTAKQIMDIVRQASDRHEWPDNIYGYGIPDFWQAYITGTGLNNMQ